MISAVRLDGVKTVGAAWLFGWHLFQLCGNAKSYLSRDATFEPLSPQGITFTVNPAAGGGRRNSRQLSPGQRYSRGPSLTFPFTLFLNAHSRLLAEIRRAIS
jgi:hypothetical protein